MDSEIETWILQTIFITEDACEKIGCEYIYFSWSTSRISWDILQLRGAHVIYYVVHVLKHSPYLTRPSKILPVSLPVKVLTLVLMYMKACVIIAK